MSLNPKVFVISALQRDPTNPTNPSNPGSDLETVYLCVDDESGGYPCWSRSFRDAEVFNERPDVEKYLKGFDYIWRNVGMICVYEVVLESA